MSDIVVVSDSGPLIALARIDRLGLLRQMSSQVLVPPAVWNEVVEQAKDAPGAREIGDASWVSVQAPDALAADALSVMVDRGEAEAISLAMGVSDSLLLVDDARARRLAESLSVRRMGTIGLLRNAKKIGLVESLRREIEALRDNGVYVRQALIDAVLKDVGE